MEKDLIEGCAAGNEQCWEKLISYVYPKARKVAMGILRDSHLAEDVVQNSLVKLMRSLNTLQNPASFDAWLNRLVKNEAYMTLRLGKSEFPGELFDSDAPVNSIYPPDISESVAFQAELVKAVRKLPLEHREVIVFHELQGYKMHEIARMLEIPLGTVKSRLYRARENLRAELESFDITIKKGRVKMSEKPIEELLYDYIEGFLNAEDSAKLEEKIAADPELRTKLNRQRSFVRVLHRITGKIAMSAAEIAEQMSRVKEALEDYRYTQKTTVYESEGKQVQRVELAYKKPDLHRLEYSHPYLGNVIAVAGDKEMTVLSLDDKIATIQQFTEGGLADFMFQYPVLIETLSQNGTVTLLNKEVVNEKTCYHLVFSQEAPMLKDREMLSHVWIEENTWFPMLEEYYDVDGNLLMKKEVENLNMNAGLEQSYFTLEIPEDFTIDRSTSEGAPQMRTVSMKEAAEEVGFDLYIIPENEKLTLHNVSLIYFQGNPVVLQNYHQAGQSVPYLTMTQSIVEHSSIPPGYELEEVMVGDEKGDYMKMEVPGVKGMVFLEKDGIHLAVGGMMEKEENLRLAEQLKRAGV